MGQVGRGQGWGVPGQPSIAKDRGDEGGALAPVIAQFGETEPERDDAAEQVGVVAALVTPLLVLGMRGGPVEFHANPVILVEVVEVPVTDALPDSRLPTRYGKPMRTLDPADVAVSSTDKAPSSASPSAKSDLPAPAHLLARIHGLAYPVGGGAPAADGPADPRIGVIEGRCDLDEIEHRVLHPGARREHGRMPGPQDRIRPMDDDAGNLHSRRAPRCRDRDRDDGARLSSRPCRSAAVWWLRTASGPARSRAAHSTVSRAGSPEKVAYTPRCSRCQRPLPDRLRIARNPTPATAL